MSHVNTPLPNIVGWHWTDAGKTRGVSGSLMHALTGVLMKFANERAAEHAGSKFAPISSLASMKQSRPSSTASHPLSNALSIVPLSKGHILPTMAWHQALYGRRGAAVHLHYRLSLLLYKRKEGFIQALVTVGALGPA